MHSSGKQHRSEHLAVAAPLDRLHPFAAEGAAAMKRTKLTEASGRAEEAARMKRRETQKLALDGARLFVSLIFDGFACKSYGSATKNACLISGWPIEMKRNGRDVLHLLQGCPMLGRAT